MKLRTRLLLLVAASIGIMLAIVVAGIIGILTATATTDEIVDVRLPSVMGLDIVNEGKTAVHAASLTAALYQNNHDAADKFTAVLAERRRAWARIDKGWKLYESLPQTPEEALLWKQFVSDWDRWTEVDSELEARIKALSTNDSPDDQGSLFAGYFQDIYDALPLFLKAEEGLEKVIAINVELADAAVAQGHKGATMAKTVMLSAGALAGIAMLVFGLLTTRIILRQIGGEPAYAAKVADRIASGDLEAEVELQRGDTASMLSSIKTMRDNLARIVADVRQGSDAIATASQQIASGNLDLSSRTEEQASSLEETASSMEELTSTVKQNADNAKQANQLAESASEVAGKGGAVVAQVVTTMGSINDSSKKIVEIISVIDGIAFQTNILALNAAVEAARAGEQGRGFAVVASEVRNLAQRSAAAAKEIKLLIDDSVEKVGEGSKLVDQAGATMVEVVDSVKRVTDIMGEITAASQEQTSGIEQINQAVAQMDEVTQQNAALVEEAAAASQALQDQAGRLSELVSVFRLSSLPGSAPARASRPVAARPEPRQLKTVAKPWTSAPVRAPASAPSRPRPVAVPARQNGD